MRGCQWLTGLRIGKGNNLRVAQKDPGLDQKQKQSEGGRNITQRRVNSTLVTVLLFEGWTGMIVTRLSHIKIILYWTCDGHVVSILQKTVAASWSQTREKQAEFFFFFFSHNCQDKCWQCTFLQTTDSSVWKRMSWKRRAYGPLRFTLRTTWLWLGKRWRFVLKRLVLSPQARLENVLNLHLLHLRILKSVHEHVM